MNHKHNGPPSPAKRAGLLDPAFILLEGFRRDYNLSNIELNELLMDLALWYEDPYFKAPPSVTSRSAATNN